MKHAMRWLSLILIAVALAACQRRDSAAPSIPETPVVRAADAATSPVGSLADLPTSSTLVHVPQASLKALGDPQFRRFRMMMVREQISSDGARDGREPIRDPRVLEAMRMVPRHEFVPSSIRRYAYIDQPLEIGYGQTISQPYIVALMTELLQPKAEDRILEIGTGSGYQAAVLALLVKEVYTIEIVEPLAKRAEETLRRLGYDNVHVMAGDGYRGWPDKAPFDGVIVTAAPERIPQPLVDQLKKGGWMVIPVGSRFSQELLVLRKVDKGVERVTVIPVRFVPMVGEVQKEEKK